MNKVQNDFLFISDALNNFFFSAPKFIKPFLFIFITYLLGYWSLLRGNVYYLDDLVRSVKGNTDWHQFGRHSSEILAQTLNTSTRLTDISPFSQIVALFLMSLASLLLVRLFSKKDNWGIFLASTFLGLNPYYLQCMSYKFDSPYMAAALVSSLIPFLFINNWRIFLISSVLFLNLMLTTYQAGNSLFIIVSIFFIYKGIAVDNLPKKQIMVQTLLLLSSFLVSILIYKLLFAPNEVTSGYFNSQTLPFSDLISGIWKNNYDYLSKMYSLFKHGLLFKLVIGAMILFILNMTFTSKYKLKALIFSLLAFGLALLLSFGVYLVLVKPLFAARTHYGIGCLIAIFSIFTLSYTTKLTKYISYIVIFFIGLNLIVISTTYGNALKVQQGYAAFRTEILFSDLNQMVKNNNFKVHTNGSIGLHPIVKNSAKAFPIINRLIYQDLRQGWVWYQKIHFRYFKELKVVKSCDINGSKPIVIRNHLLHKIEQYPNNCFEVYYK